MPERFRREPCGAGRFDMSTGITFAKIVVAFALVAVFFAAPPLMEVMRRHDVWPLATAQVRVPKAPLTPVASSTTRPSTRAPITAGRASSRNKKRREVYDGYQVPAGTVLAAFLRAPLDSQTARVEDPVRVILRSSVRQDGVELIPAASIIHGKITDVIPASRWQPKGRIVAGFFFIEHADTRSRAGIAARPLVFEAVDATGARRTVDVKVKAGELVYIEMLEPLVVRIPK